MTQEPYTGLATAFGAAELYQRARAGFDDGCGVSRSARPGTR
jgi:hypothetical protein